MDALQLFRDGSLQEAIAACTREVQSHPGQPDHRDLLSQLLCFTGELERADKHLEILGTQFPDRAPVVSLIRQLIRASKARQQFYDEGRVPEFTETPPVYLQHYLQASICFRQGEADEAARLLTSAEALRPQLAGRCNGQQFQDLRDADDLTAAFLEIFTTTGKYYWIPLENIRRIMLHPIESPLDVLWRRCQIQATACSEGIVYVPQLYAGTFRAEDESLRLGRGTEWFGPDEGPVRGIGHRIFWIDDTTRPFVEIQNLEIEEVIKPAEESSPQA
ncbi:MAG: type VI secretion system accessory protein TagJ [Planctomycetota bacterium]